MPGKNSKDSAIRKWKRVISSEKIKEIPKINLCKCKDEYVSCDNSNKLIDDKSYRMEIALKALKQYFDKMMKFVETGNIHTYNPIAEEIEITAKEKHNLTKFEIENRKLLKKNLEISLKHLNKIKSKKCEKKTCEKA